MSKIETFFFRPSVELRCKRCQEPFLDLESVQVGSGELMRLRRREGRKDENEGVLPRF